MRRLLLGVAATALMALPVQAEPGGGGGGKGGDHAAQADRGGGKGGGAEKIRGNDRGPAMARSDDRGGGKGREKAQARGGSDDRGEARGKGKDRSERSAVARGNDDRDVRGRDKDRGESVDLVRGKDRDGRRIAFEEGRGVRFFDHDEPGGFKGCPPGLDKRDNGCMPPGHARKAAWHDADWFGSDWDDSYRYHDGYLLRLGDNNRVLSYVPLLGGALSPGQSWPSLFEPVTLPDYYEDFYGLSSNYGYYDNALFDLDPQTQAISGIAALLTGQDFLVGQRAPAGFDVYNVPYDWRDEYADGPDSRYRYSDGTVYQIDPKTQLVMAAIQLLT